MADEYIRKAKAIEEVNCALDRETLLFSFVRKVTISALKRLPSADVVPVRHGQWQNTRPSCMSDSIVCSECGYDSIANYTYCPNCGAKMDKG